MPKALWISAYKEITDMDKLKAYAELAGPAITKHGGTFKVRTNDIITQEGDAKPRVVVVEFDSLEAAQAAYNSPEYHEAHAKLIGGAERDLFMVEVPD